MFPPVIKIAAILAGVGTLLGGAAFLVSQVRGVYHDGVTAERALWMEKLARIEAEADFKIIQAREAGRAEAAIEKAKAETRATAAEAALKRARDEDPSLDQALRTEWPRPYFDILCDEYGPECLPPN